MKKHAILFSLVTAGLGLVSSPLQAALSVAPGDLLLALYQVNPAGTGVTANTYVYNLGAGSDYREGIAAPSIIDNINADLVSAFGPSWSSDSSVRVGVVGVVGSTDPLTSGDPARTVYFTQGFSLVPGDSSPIGFTSSQRGSASTQIKTFSSAMNGAGENGAVDGGAIYPSGNPSSFASFLPPTQTTSFGVGTTPVASMNGGTVGLDLYRVLHSASGADLTAVGSPGDASVGAGQYIGSFTLSPSGNLAFVPEPSTGVLAGLGALFALRRRRRA